MRDIVLTRNAWPVQLPLVEMKPRGISNDRLFEASVGLDVTAGQEPFTPPMQVDPVTASFPAFFQPVSMTTVLPLSSSALGG